MHVVFAERDAQHLVAHAAAGGVGHLGVLHVIARVGEQVVVAGVVLMHVGDDDVLDLVGLDAERLQPLADRLDDLCGRAPWPPASSKPVSTTKVPCGPLITQT